MPSSTAIPANSFLRVEGREILDASGRPVLLRGVNIDTAYHSYTRADFLATIAGLGLNQTHIGLIGLQETGVEYVI